MNHTNFEEIKMEQFQMDILMNAYFLIIVVDVFYLELSAWRLRQVIQSWRELSVRKKNDINVLSYCGYTMQNK